MKRCHLFLLFKYGRAPIYRTFLVINHCQEFAANYMFSRMFLVSMIRLRVQVQARIQYHVSGLPYIIMVINSLQANRYYTYVSSISQSCLCEPNFDSNYTFPIMNGNGICAVLYAMMKPGNVMITQIIYT